MSQLTPGPKFWRRSRQPTWGSAPALPPRIAAPLRKLEHALDQQLDRVDNQLTSVFHETFPEVTRIVDPYREMQVKLQEVKKNAVIETVTAPHIRSIDIIDSISKSIPENITLDVTRMVISPDTVLISGNTDTFKSVDDIKNRLEQIEYFKKVTISSSNTDRSGKEVRFQLKVEL